MKTPARVMVVEDEAITALDLCGELQRMGYEICGVADTADGAVEMARGENPDLILMDVRLGEGGDGIDTAQRICAERETAIVFLSAHSDDATLDRALGAVPFGYLVKPFRARELKLAIEVALSKQAKDAARRRQLGEQAVTDPLTGVANRRKMDEMLAVEWERGRREGTPVAALVIDIDFFKKYNDHYGHPAGDECLKAVARAIDDLCLRPGDLACRWGGEEFFVLLPATDQAGADHLAAALVRAVRQLRLPHAASAVAESVTVSVGAAAVQPGPEHQPGELVEHADRALYRAKQEGRDRYVGAFAVAAEERLKVSRCPFLSGRYGSGAG